MPRRTPTLPLAPDPARNERQHTNRAVALTYAPHDAAPRVVARGTGLIAEEIIRRAREAGVFVHESPELVRLLAKVDLDAHIPPALYFAVAEIFAWIYAADRSSAELAARATTPDPQNAHVGRDR
jgi:flagellar biosynthesis protein